VLKTVAEELDGESNLSSVSVRVESKNVVHCTVVIIKRYARSNILAVSIYVASKEACPISILDCLKRT
jgi:hypothetical protein